MRVLIGHGSGAIDNARRRRARPQTRKALRTLLTGACSIVFGLAACQSTTSPRSDVSGSYRLISVDGDSLPCCGYTASGGKDTVVALLWGDLSLLPDGTYSWTNLWQYSWQEDSLSSFAQGVDSAMSAGRYSVSGRSLILQDSASGAPITASFNADTLDFAFRVHQYAFVKRPPPAPEGNWAGIGCHDPNGGSPGCPRTDSTGAEFVDAVGAMEVGHFRPPGRYEWEHLYDYGAPTGDSTRVSVYEEGSYTWDGTTLTMVPDDSVTYSRATGTLQGNAGLTLRRQNRVYTFFRFLGGPCPTCATRGAMISASHPTFLATAPRRP